MDVPGRYSSGWWGADGSPSVLLQTIRAQNQPMWTAGPRKQESVCIALVNRPRWGQGIQQDEVAMTVCVGEHGCSASAANETLSWPSCGISEMLHTRLEGVRKIRLV